MKKCVMWIACAIMFLFVRATYAQNGQSGRMQPIQPSVLGISDSKTTNLIFPYSIKSVDRGHDALLVQKATQAENVLQVKASGPGFKETNLTVITGDGTLYSFILTYAQNPSFLNLTVGDADYGGNPVVLFSSSAANEGRLQQTSALIGAKTPVLRGPGDRKYNIGMTLHGIYIKNDVLYFQVTLENRTNLTYTIDQLRFFIGDKKQARRTASQELEVVPVYVDGNAHSIGSKSKQTLVFAIPKFTIPDQKFLCLQLMEKNGGRHLKLRISNHLVINAWII